MNLNMSCSTPRTGEEPECVFICRPEELLWPSQVTVAGVCEECCCRAIHVLGETLSHFLPGCNK